MRELCTLMRVQVSNTVSRIAQDAFAKYELTPTPVKAKRA